MRVTLRPLSCGAFVFLLGLGVGLGSSAQAGLIAYWDMDESSGATSAIDSIGIADAVADSSTTGEEPTAGATGKYGNAWSFAETNDNRLQVANPNQAIFATLGFSGWSYSGWVNTTHGSGPDTIFSISDSAAGSEEAALRLENGIPNFLGRHNANNNVGLNGSSSIADGQWHHLAVTSSSAGGTQLYVDGVVADSSVEGVDIATFTTTVGNVSVNFGANNDNGGGMQWEYEGLIDEFRVYNHKLSGAEVAALVPEPGSLALALLGLCGLAATRLRRQ